MIQNTLIVPKTWRSELPAVLCFGAFSVVAIELTRWLPGSVIHGKLFSLGGVRVDLGLPLFWFLPAIALGTAMYRIYNVRYKLDNRGIESRTGILALQQRSNIIRYEDIRGIEVRQTILERALDIGSVDIGTASTGGVEVRLSGIACPHDVHSMIQVEREFRQKRASRSGDTQSSKAAVNT